MYLLWILGWVYLRHKSGAKPNALEESKNVTNDHRKSTSKICRFGDPQQHEPNRPLRLRKSFGTGVKNRESINIIISLFIFAAELVFSRCKWAVRINHCSLCEFISCSVLSSFHKSIMDHQFASSVSSLAATLRALFNFKNRLATESAKKCYTPNNVPLLRSWPQNGADKPRDCACCNNNTICIN